MDNRWKTDVVTYQNVQKGPFLTDCKSPIHLTVQCNLLIVVLFSYAHSGILLNLTAFCVRLR